MALQMAKAMPFCHAGAAVATVSLKLDVGAQTLPASFALRGNYPNPLPALVTVEVMDVTGRRVLTAPSVGLAAGWSTALN